MTPPSWQPDPMGRHELRWWDGQQWTDHVSDQGATSLDPMQAVPPTPAVTPQPGTPTPATPQPTGSPWAAPTVPLPVTPLPITPSAPSSGSSGGGRRRTPLVIGAAVAVLVLGVGAGVYVITSDDDPAVVSTTTVHSTTTLSPTDSTDTPVTTDAGSTTSSPSGSADLDALLATLPSADDVPLEWVQDFDGTTEVEAASGPGYGYCGGGNAVARANDIGNVSIVYGPGWSLPDGSSFGADLLVFDSDAEAQAFLDGTYEQANACADAPVSYTAAESDVDWLEDGYGDDAEWTVFSLSTALIGPALASDAEVRGYVDDNYSTTVDGNAFGVTYSTITVYERHGRTVVLCWADGSWGWSGFASTPDWAHRPDDVELDRTIADYRSLVVSRLEEIGAV